MVVINVNHLSKNYGDIKAVDDISFAVNEGEIFGMIGPNGAGKTTTIECLEGLRQPNFGSIYVLGLSPHLNRKKLYHLIGVQLQETQFQDKASVHDLCKLFASFYEKPQSCDELLREFELFDKKKAYVGRLSGGQRQRLSIVLALIPNPQIIFLDELTTGLDPQARHDVWNLIKNLREKGITIFLTTHFMDEAEALCDRVAVMDRGKIIAMDTPANLIKKNKTETMIIFTSNNADSEMLKSINGITKVEKRGDKIIAYGSGGNILSDLVLFLEKSGVEFNNLTIEQPNLEDVFMELTGKKVRD